MFGEDYRRDVEDIRAGRARLIINNSKAIPAAAHTSGPRLWAHLLWTWVHFLIYPAAILSMFWWPWWWGGIAIAVNVNIVFPALRKAAGALVGEEAMNNNYFMAACIIDGTLTVERNESAT